MVLYCPGQIIIETCSEQLDRSRLVEVSRRINTEVAGTGLNRPSTVLILTLQVLERGGIPATHALVFWTHVVLLDVDRHIHEDNPYAMAIRDRDGQDVGYINMTAEWRDSRPGRLSFIPIARNMRRAEPLLDLLCVE